MEEAEEHTVRRYDDGAVIAIVFFEIDTSPSAPKHARSEFPHPLVTVDYSTYKDNDIYQVSAVGAKRVKLLDAYRDELLDPGEFDIEHMIARIKP